MNLKLTVFLAIIVSVFSGCARNHEAVTEASLQQTVPDGIVLENDNILAVFSKENGALLRLSYKKTGWNIQDRDSLALSFNALVPLKERRNNLILGTKQKLASFQVSPDGKTATFAWDHLESEYGGVMDISLTGIVSIDANGLTFNMDVVNNSPNVIEAIGYPSLGDVTQPSKDEKLENLRSGYAGMDRSSLLPKFDNFCGYWGVDWPTQLVKSHDSPFILVAASNQGLYSGDHDNTSKEMVQWTFELKPGTGTSDGVIATPEEAGKFTPHMEMKVWHFPYVNPGEKTSLSPVVLNPYSGDWHQGTDNYKAWRKTWYKQPPTPEWALDVHSWLQLHINSPEQEWRIQFKDLPKYAEECARYGVSAIQLVGWNNGGQDGGNPSHDPDPHMGTFQDLKEAIAACEQLGVHIILFNKYTWSDQSTDWFKKELIKYSIKNPYGDYFNGGGYAYQTPTQLGDINVHPLVPMCPNSEKWRDIAYKEFAKNIDLGATGMLFDECQHHYGGPYCFDKTHGHHVPVYSFYGDIPLVTGFREIIAKRNPNFLISGEACYDFENQYYSLAYFRIDPYWQTQIKRYINPAGAIMVAATGFNDRVMLNACLRYRYIISYEPFNFKGKLSDFPMTVEYGKKIDALRMQFRDYVWDGEFRDVLEASVTEDGKNYPSYSVFRHAGGKKHAVVVVNNDAGKEKTVKVKIDGSTQPLVYVTPENLTPQQYTGKVGIPAKSAVVVMEK